MRARYLREGALWPLRALPTCTARSLGRRLLADIDRSGGSFKSNDALYYKAHLIFDVVDELARMSTIVDHVKQVLESEDILLWDASIPIKPPSGKGDQGLNFPLHQDATYWGIGPTDSIATCWVALSDASRQHGCMHAVLGSHLHGQLPHESNPSDASMLRRGQRALLHTSADDPMGPSGATANAEGGGAAAAHMELLPGELSIHHPYVLHGSGVNRGSSDRIGVVLNYLTPSARPLDGSTGSATLIAGRSCAPHWRLTSHRPTGRDCLDPRSLCAHQDALSVHRGDLLARSTGVEK